jgi:hypothetical protein
MVRFLLPRLKTLLRNTMKNYFEIRDELMEFEPKDTLVWNTGRTYTAQGQRMAACRTPHGIAFADKDRNISGLIELPCELREWDVMFHYDRFTYKEGGIPWQLEKRLTDCWR